MKNRVVIFALLLSFLAVPLYGQDTNSVKHERTTQLRDFFANLSTTGTGAGYKLHFRTDNQDLLWNLGIQANGVRNKDEYTYFDYYTYEYRKGNNPFWTVMIPLTVGVKYRIGRESIEDNFRPFITAEGGPSWGVAFRTDLGFNHSIKQGSGAVGYNGFIGFGVDFGDSLDRNFGITLGFQFAQFTKDLGESDIIQGFNVRFNFLNFMQ